MRVFVKYNGAGEVVSVSKVKVMPPEQEHPYGTLKEGESVMEVPPEMEQATLDPLELHVGHRVDVQSRKLLRKPKP